MIWEAWVSWEKQVKLAKHKINSQLNTAHSPDMNPIELCGQS